jgi:hypothetical protein
MIPMRTIVASGLLNCAGRLSLLGLSIALCMLWWIGWA